LVQGGSYRVAPRSVQAREWLVAPQAQGAGEQQHCLLVVAASGLADQCAELIQVKRTWVYRKAIAAWLPGQGNVAG
jgi:hypothetical protein